ncbi:MAG: HyaD/HybD family hydrogenase maturation endopeptidase [Nitrospirae bacterium]|nr:MAG: HyaD/HybD family hydrogenase maturation endopeptidase [Nitrospirota bacterium]
MKILILGIGNILMSDEGVGIRSIEELERRFKFPENVELLDGGTSGIELLSYISSRDYLIVIDSVKSGLPPGTVVKIEGEDVPAKFRTRISPHQLGLSDILAAARLTDELPKQMVLFGIEPKKIGVGLELSQEVKKNFDKLLNVVIEEVRKIGYDISPRHAVSDIKSVWGNY